MRVFRTLPSPQPSPKGRRRLKIFFAFFAFFALFADERFFIFMSALRQKLTSNISHDNAMLFFIVHVFITTTPLLIIYHFQQGKLIITRNRFAITK